MTHPSPPPSIASAVVEAGAVASSVLDLDALADQLRRELEDVLALIARPVMPRNDRVARTRAELGGNVVAVPLAPAWSEPDEPTESVESPAAAAVASRPASLPPTLPPGPPVDPAAVRAALALLASPPRLAA